MKCGWPLIVLSVLVLTLACSPGVSEVNLEDDERFAPRKDVPARIEAFKQRGASGSGGISVSLWAGDNFRVERATGLLYGPARTRFNADMVFINNDREEPRPFTLVALLDFLPIPLSLDNRWSMAHTMSLQPGEVRHLEIETGPLPNGAHTILLSAIWKPQTIDFPVETDDPGMLLIEQMTITTPPTASRFYLVIGNILSRPALEPFMESALSKPLSIIDLETSIQKERVTIDDSITIEDGSHVFESLVVKPEEEVTLFVDIFNDSAEEVPFVVVPLVDGLLPEGASPFYASVPACTQNVYPINFVAPPFEAEHELVLLYASTPYEYLQLMDGGEKADARSVNFGEIYCHQAEPETKGVRKINFGGSNRVTLSVQDR